MGTGHVSDCCPNKLPSQISSIGAGEGTQPPVAGAQDAPEKDGGAGREIRSRGFGVRQTRILTLSLTTWVTLEKPLSLSGPRFPRL